MKFIHLLAFNPANVEKITRIFALCPEFNVNLRKDLFKKEACSPGPAQ